MDWSLEIGGESCFYLLAREDITNICNNGFRELTLKPIGHHQIFYLQSGFRYGKIGRSGGTTRELRFMVPSGLPVSATG